MQSCNKRSLFSKDIFSTSVLATLIIGLICHVFAFTNISFSHDSIYVYNPDTYKLALGRWASFLLKPLLNNLELPWLSGCISLFAISLSVFFLVILFEIRDKVIVWLVAGLFVTNISFTLLNATYCHDAFTYMLGVLCIIVSVYFIYIWLYKKDIKYRYIIFAILFLCVGIAFYQAYLPLYSGCIILLCIKEILTTNEDNLKKTLIFVGYAIIIMIVAGILYKVFLNICLYAYNVSLANEYNGVTNVFDFSNQSIIKLLVNCYVMPLKPILSKHFVFYRIMFYIICFCTILVNILIFIEKRQKFFAILFAELLFPFGLNFVYILSKGLMHDLMVFHYFLFLLLPIILLEQKINKVTNSPNTNSAIRCFNCNNRFVKNSLFSSIRKIIIFCLIGLIGSQISFANTVYLKKQLEYQSTYSVCNRIINRLEDIDNYQYNIHGILKTVRVIS